MEIPTGEGLHEGSEWWYELPENVKQKVLAWLPAERLCRYCVVCKEWNALISSTQFITNDWLAAPPNQKPWLLLFLDWETLDYMAYCLFTKTWKRLSLAFLKNRYDFDILSVEASAAGLFLTTCVSSNNKYVWRYIVCNPLTGKSIELPRIEGGTIWGHDHVWRHIVCNPLTGKSIELPRIEGGTIWGMTMIAEKGHGHNGDTYKVIGIETSENRVEIYDSSLKSWTTAGRLPQNFNPRLTGPTVASRDFLYVKGKDKNSSRRGILAFSIQNGRSVFTPLPLEYNKTVIFACESRVLLGSCISGPDDIIISELRNSLSIVQVTEIARIPLSRIPLSTLDPNGRGGTLLLDFEGTRDLVFIRDRRSNEVLVYNLSQFTSTRLSGCPMAPLLRNWYHTPGCFVFEPRPDKDVE